jgi:hypothetical protein
MADDGLPGAVRDDLERRGERRACFDGWVEIVGRETRVRGSGRDLSRAGLGAVVRSPHPALHTHVEAEFALPGIRLPIVLPGVVAWSDAATGRIGLRFDDIEPGIAELIGSFAAGRL